MGRWIGHLMVVTKLQTQVQQVAQGQTPLHSDPGAFDGGDRPAALMGIKDIWMQWFGF
jgi:hypothetical protein